MEWQLLSAANANANGRSSNQVLMLDYQEIELVFVDEFRNRSSLGSDSCYNSFVKRPLLQWWLATRKIDEGCCTHRQLLLIRGVGIMSSCRSGSGVSLVRC